MWRGLPAATPHEFAGWSAVCPRSAQGASCHRTTSMSSATRVGYRDCGQCPKPVAGAAEQGNRTAGAATHRWRGPGGGGVPCCGDPMDWKFMLAEGRGPLLGRSCQATTTEGRRWHRLASWPRAFWFLSLLHRGPYPPGFFMMLKVFDSLLDITKTPRKPQYTVGQQFPLILLSSHMIKCVHQVVDLLLYGNKDS